MSIGTKNRLTQNGTLCKAHLREKHPQQLGLVAEFIAEIEGSGKSHDPTRWSQFTDATHNTAAMLKAVDASYEKWLNP